MQDTSLLLIILVWCALWASPATAQRRKRSASRATFPAVASHSAASVAALVPTGIRRRAARYDARRVNWARTRLVARMTRGLHVLPVRLATVAMVQAHRRSVGAGTIRQAVSRSVASVVRSTSTVARAQLHV